MKVLSDLPKLVSSLPLLNITDMWKSLLHVSLYYMLILMNVATQRFQSNSTLSSLQKTQYFFRSDISFINFGKISTFYPLLYQLTFYSFDRHQIVFLLQAFKFIIFLIIYLRISSLESFAWGLAAIAQLLLI